MRERLSSPRMPAKDGESAMTTTSTPTLRTTVVCLLLGTALPSSLANTPNLNIIPLDLSPSVLSVGSGAVAPAEITGDLLLISQNPMPTFEYVRPFPDDPPGWSHRKKDHGDTGLDGGAGTINSVPDPTTIALLVFGGAACFVRRQRSNTP